MSDIYDWVTCDHRGIGRVGCRVCDRDPARVRIRAEREEVMHLRAVNAELLAALERVVQTWDEDGPFHDDAMELARAAIARAKGGT